MNGAILTGLIGVIVTAVFWLGWRFGHLLFGVDRRSFLRRTRNPYWM